ncbi:MAG: metallophosphoesterase [Gammaproteobacteria bacterium SHHR-1]|uniref:metallophosphoesterase n=1 Tax=Magnetovirga frankeli TaxID=947516 RepID=UPI0012934782|nr:metallophosphoesterase [gamma proteobacterium SS-5]
MNKKTHPGKLLNYPGRRWLPSELHLPDQTIDWLEAGRGAVGKDRSDHKSLGHGLEKALRQAPWAWPKRPVYFFGDPHADADALVNSLVAAGVAKKTGAGTQAFRLTRRGRASLLILGGDFLDKGPSLLRLLDVLQQLRAQSPELILLAGNHDLRLLMGIGILDRPRDRRTEHFFLRMGPKIVPFLKEVSDTFLQHKGALKGVPSHAECRRRLYPSDKWFRDFPGLAQWVMPEATVHKELDRMEKKLQRFEQACQQQGLGMRQVYAAAHRCRQLFLREGGAYHWFYQAMQLAHREGSFLFVHAGVDDRLAGLIERSGLDYINHQFSEQVVNDPFEFYYGPLANALRTKYRNTDMPLTAHGVKRLHRLGISAVVHGHRNRLNGQRLMLRQGLPHFECDTTLDCHSRRHEGLQGPGAAATLIDPQGFVLGISNDYPLAKLFQPHLPQT